MLRRRSFLGGLSAAALAAPVLGSAVAAPARARPRIRRPNVPLPLTFVNNTGNFDNSSISLYIVGVNGSGEQCRVTPEGELVPVSMSDNGEDGFADYSIPLNNNGDTKIDLPAMSGRIYFALDGKLKFKVVESDNGPSLQHPAGWVPGEPGNDVLHDTFEFTLKDDGMYCNTTMVDMFSVPSSINLKGDKDQTTGTIEPGGREKIFNAVTSVEGFEQLQQGERRIIAPGHALDIGKFPEDYFSAYIDEVWEKYSSAEMKVDIDTGEVFTGKVNGDKLVFDGEVGEFNRPTTRDVLFCDGELAAGDAPRGPVAAILGAGFNRSALHNITDQPASEPKQFYTHNITNHYAKVMHENTVDGKAYGFAFDDVANFASYIEDGAPTEITLTLTPW